MLVVKISQRNNEVRKNGIVTNIYIYIYNPVKRKYLDWTSNSLGALARPVGTCCYKSAELDLTRAIAHSLGPGHFGMGTPGV